MKYSFAVIQKQLDDANKQIRLQAESILRYMEMDAEHHTRALEAEKRVDELEELLKIQVSMISAQLKSSKDKPLKRPKLLI